MAGPKHSLEEKALEWYLETPYEELKVLVGEDKLVSSLTNEEILELYKKTYPKNYENKYREVTKRYNQ